MSQILGHRLYGDGPQGVIVLHDWMGDASEWQEAAPYLDSSAHTFAFADVRGYGQSIDLDGRFDVDEIAADIFALADHLNWETFALIGHSMTGMATQRALVNDSSRRISKAVAISPVTANGYPADEATKQFLWQAIDDPDVTAQGFGALTGGRLGTPWIAKRTSRFNESANKDAVRAYYDMWLETDFSTEVAAASPATPLLVLAGRNDLPGFDEDTYASTIGRWFSNVRFEFVTDAGHYAMQETPVLTATLINEHLSA